MHLPKEKTKDTREISEDLVLELLRHKLTPVNEKNMELYEYESEFRAHF